MRYAEARDAKGRNPELLERVGFMPGALGWVIDRYLVSNEYRSKAPGTQRAYDVGLRTLRAAPISRGLLRDLNRQHVNAHCEEISKRLGKSRGDHQAMMLSILWDFADRHLSQCKLSDRSNPTRRRKRVYEPTPRDAWSPGVCKRFLDGASPELALAFALLLYTGQRRGDVCKMKWNDLLNDGRGDFISVLSNSRCRRTTTSSSVFSCLT